MIEPKWLADIIRIHDENGEADCIECDQITLLLAHVRELREALRGMMCDDGECGISECYRSHVLLDRQEPPEVDA